MNRWQFLWRRARSQIWFRASLYAAFGVAAALFAVVATPFVPKAMADRLGGESVEQILTILASSLLAVATFSLGAWVSAYTAVSQAATPRVAQLVTSDEASQKSLSTFVGAFLYAVVAVTAVNAQYYGLEGRAVLFLTSLAVVVLVAFRLLAWIHRLSQLARLGHMVDRVEETTAEGLGEHPPEPARPHLKGAAFHARSTGYVQNIDLARLQETAEELDVVVEIAAPVGAFRRRGEVLGLASCEALSPEVETRLQDAFSVARARTFDQDPRYGLIVLGEIGARALSPGVNDPGTAIQVVGVAVRLIDDWARPEEPGAARPDPHDRIVRPPLEPAVLLDDVLGPVIRYGSGDLAVAIRLQKALASLGRSGSTAAGAARDLADAARARAMETLPKADRDAYRAACKEAAAPR